METVSRILDKVLANLFPDFQFVETAGVTLVPHTRGKQGRCSAWNRSYWWETSNGLRYQELAIPAHVFDGNPDSTLAWVMHECVHLYCHYLTIPDTASNGRHNTYFANYARNVGLFVEDRKDSYGIGYTTMSEPLRDHLRKLCRSEYKKLGVLRRL